MATAVGIGQKDGATPDGLAAPHPTLMGALLAVQAEAPTIQKDATAKIETKGGGSYTYKYLKLSTLMEAILPLLSKNGLVWVTLPGMSPDGIPVLHYQLVHAASGESLDGTMALMLTVKDPQGQGSAITYARRYTVLAVLGIVADEDADGKPKTPPAPRAPRLLTAERNENMMKAIDDAGKDPELIFSAVGVSDSRNITVAQAKKVRAILDGKS